jgi:hypothetical protein
VRILKPPYPDWGEFTAVDPGRDYYAAARFANSEVTHVLMEVPGVFIHPPGQGLVIEMPQVYRTGQARLKDVTELAFSAGAIAARYENVIRYLPAEWKGQVPKNIHQARIMAALTQSERKILDGIKKKDLQHILDAIGLGLFHLGRLGR